jgi:hypothetical protein
MPKPLRILLIADVRRPDSFRYLIEKGNEHFEWIILWQYKAPAKEFLPGVSMIGWSDFATPCTLIDQVKPDKIIFFETIDMWQIPLIVHAKKRKVTTAYLAHGVYASIEAAKKRFNENPGEKSFRAYARKLYKSFFSILKTRFYYYAALKDLNSIRSMFQYLLLPVFFKFYSPIEALSKTKFPERTPDYALLFCNNNVPYFKLFNQLHTDRIINTGVPLFDKFYNSGRVEEDYIVFIDHPYLEINILGWSDEFHRKVAESLYNFSEANNIKLIIKLHPVSDIQNWKRYNFQKGNVEVIQANVPEELYLKAKLILGYSSTLLIGFLCAQKNVVLLGWHPTPQVYGVNFYETGICHISYDASDLQTQYQLWLSHNMSLQNKKEYDTFLKHFNYPFDGKAGERILDAISYI